jgi:hypothetical protein
MAKNDDEDYWNSSDMHQKPFSFAEEEEVQYKMNEINFSYGYLILY